MKTEFLHPIFRRFGLPLTLLFFLTLEARSQEARFRFHPGVQEEVRLITWKYQAGDGIDWADSRYDDSRWKTIQWNDLNPTHRGIHWLRTRVRIEREGSDPVILRILLLYYPYEVYFNGILVGKNGQLGSAGKEERIGKISQARLLPDHLMVEGDNVLAIRFSNFRADHFSTFRVRLDTRLYENLYGVENRFRMLAYATVCLTCFLVGIALFLGGGMFTHYLLFSLMCLPPLGIKTFEFLMYYLNLEVSYHRHFLSLFNISYILSDLFLISFLLFVFERPKKPIYLGMWLAISMGYFFLRWKYDVHLLLIGGYFAAYDIYLLLMGSYLIVILIFAWRAGRPGSLLALFGLSIYLLPRVLILLNHSVDSLYLDVSYLTWIVILLFMTSGQVREQEKTRRGLELRAQRLEIELLKRTIQPHFLLNTLSSVKSLLVRRPDEADELIQVLASEFRMIGAISSARLIPLQQELELCRYHLKIMSCRRSAQYFLHTEHLPEEASVPPLLFHSLIENGITHSFKPTEQGTFWLSSEEDDTQIRYIMKNDGSLLQKLSPDDPWEEGIGIKYVKSRLEESYPGKWQLEYGLRDSKWETVITVPHS